MRPHAAVLVILLGCRDKSPPAEAPPPDPVAKAPHVQPAPHPRPTLPEAPKLSADATFTQQTRDAEWAPSTESEIKKRFAKVRGGKLEQAECRQSQCKLTIAGSQGDISRTIADLESDRGLHGYATTILLTAPEKKPDGSLVLRAYATFER